ncbi:MAG: hypothetical protein PHD95_00820 [Candidatus ainarchaeum sp.]|nr:hypothetical protein [Candidatus ainarchaeum sp.]
MDFRPIIPSEKLMRETIWLEEKLDFEKLVKKTENKEYFFSFPSTIEDENGEEVPVKTNKIVFDKESQTYFGFEEQIVSDEKLAKLKQLHESEDASELFSDLTIEQDLEKAGIQKESLLTVLSEFLEKNQGIEDTFFLDKAPFQFFVFEKIPKLKKIAAIDSEHSRWHSIRTYFERLKEEPTIKGAIAKINLAKLQEKTKLFEGIAKELLSSEDYQLAKTETEKKEVITEKLYSQGTTDFSNNDLLRIKSMAGMLQRKKPNSKIF